MSMDEQQRVLAELYRAYAGRVYARCAYVLRDPEEARDAMQDVFIKVQKNLDGFRKEASPLTWITHIATNHCLNVLRSQRAPWHERYRTEVEHAARHTDAPVDLREQHQLLRVCLAYVAAKDPALSAMAVHHFVDDMPQAQLCALCGVSAPTLRKRLRAFIALSREALSAAVPGIAFVEEAA
jgi:RNA polymerase sigma-70 factor, ECF subfamily